MFFVQPIRLSVQSVPALSDSPFGATMVDALEATLETSTEHISMLESQVAFKDEDQAGEVGQVQSLGGQVGLVEENVFQCWQLFVNTAHNFMQLIPFVTIPKSI